MYGVDVHLVVPARATVIFAVRLALLVPKACRLWHTKAGVHCSIRVHLDLHRNVVGVVRRGVPCGDLVRNGGSVGSGGRWVRNVDILGLERIGHRGRVVSLGHVARVQHAPEVAHEHRLDKCLAGGGTVEEVVCDPLLDHGRRDSSRYGCG